MSKNLEKKIEYISGIGPKYVQRLNQLGVETVRDLLYFFPFRYDDLSKISQIIDLKIGEIATLEVKIKTIKNIRTWKKRIAITEGL